MTLDHLSSPLINVTDHNDCNNANNIISATISHNSNSTINNNNDNLNFTNKNLSELSPQNNQTDIDNFNQQVYYRLNSLNQNNQNYKHPNKAYNHQSNPLMTQQSSQQTNTSNQNDRDTCSNEQQQQPSHTLSISLNYSALSGLNDNYSEDPPLSISKEEKVVFEYVKDPSRDMFQIGR